ncbi:MAG: universal stress protein [Acidobacteriaceae bacterium]
MFKKIAVAYDDSKSAQHALATAISLAASLGSNLRIVTIVEPQPFYVNIALAADYNLPDLLQNERRERLQQSLKLALQHAANAGVEAEATLVDGREVEGILAEITSCCADLLVLGLSQHHGFAEMTSTVHRISLHTPCPILGVH